MTKPTMKKEVAIHKVMPSRNIVFFYATNDAADDFVEFGLLENGGNGKSHYRLEVDTRFNFDEVLGYIENYSNL